MINQNSIEKERFSLLTDNVDKFVSRPIKSSHVKTTIQIVEQRRNEFEQGKQQQNNIKQILLIDDNPLIVDYYQDVLDLFGITNCLKAYNGLKGVELYEQHCKNIKLVIVDYEMPDITGFQCSQQIREFTQKRGIKYLVPIVMCSGNDGDFYEQQAKEVQAFYFLKPLKAQKIEEILKKFNIIK